MSFMPILQGAATIAPYALAAFSHGGKTDYAALQRWMASMHPEGYVSASDRAAAASTEARGSTAASRSAEEARMGAARRATARGYQTAPAAEATYGRIAEGEARGKQAAADRADEQLYSAELGNKRFEQQKDLSLIGSRLGAAAGDKARADYQHTSLLNSLIQYTPAALDSIDGLLKAHPQGATAQPRTFNHSTGRFENLMSEPTGRAGDFGDEGGYGGGAGGGFSAGGSAGDSEAY